MSGRRYASPGTTAADGVSIWERSQQSALGPPRHGGVYLAIRYGDRLVDAGINPSVASVGDSYDNSLAETIIGLYKTPTPDDLRLPRSSRNRPQQQPKNAQPAKACLVDGG